MKGVSNHPQGPFHWPCMIQGNKFLKHFIRPSPAVSTEVHFPISSCSRQVWEVKIEHLVSDMLLPTDIYLTTLSLFVYGPSTFSFSISSLESMDFSQPEHVSTDIPKNSNLISHSRLDSHSITVLYGDATSFPNFYHHTTWVHPGDKIQKKKNSYCLDGLQHLLFTFLFVVQHILSFAVNDIQCNLVSFRLDTANAHASVDLTTKLCRLQSLVVV